MTTYSLFSDAKRDTALTAVGGEMMGTQDTELLKQIFVAAGNASGSGQFVPLDPNNPSQMDAAYLPDQIDARVSVLTGTDAALLTEELALGEIAAPTDKTYLRRGDGVNDGGRIVAGGLVFTQSYNIGTIENGTIFSGIELLPGIYEVVLQFVCENASAANDVVVTLQGTEAFSLVGRCEFMTFSNPTTATPFFLADNFTVEVLGSGNGPVHGACRGVIEVPVTTELSASVNCSDNQVTSASATVIITARA